MQRNHNLRILSESGYKLEEVELIELAIAFFLKELAKKVPFEAIYGEIKIVDDIKSESIGETLNGDMMEIHGYRLDNGDFTNYYVCRIADYTNSIETIRTLAHELIHVWQTQIGKLSRNTNEDWIWNGKNYGAAPYDGTNNDLLLPWEKEADKLDLLLTKKFYNFYLNR